MKFKKIHSKTTISALTNINNFPTNRTSVVRSQDNIVRARLHADKGIGHAGKFEAQLRSNRTHVEGSLHLQTNFYKAPWRKF